MANLSHKERGKMILCPCAQFKNQQLVSQDCCLCCHENADILNIPPLIEMGGTWISPQNPVNIWFLIIRIILMLYVIYCAMFTLILYSLDGHWWAYFMYLTQWTAICTVILMILNVAATITVYCMAMDPELDVNVFKNEVLDTNTHVYRIYILQEIFFQMMLVVNVLVILQFWLLAFKPSVFAAYPLQWKLANVQLHAATFIAVFIDYIISAQRLYYKSAIWGFFFGTVYTIWTVIFEAFIHKNENGVTYLYAVYDWSESKSPFIIYIGSIFVVVGINSLFAFIKKLILMYCSNIHHQKNKEFQQETVNKTEITASI